MASRHRGDFTRGNFSTYQGTNKTVKQLREMGEHVLIAAKEALKEGVDDLVADAKSRAPRRTGKLQESIKAISHKKGAEYEIQANEPAINQAGIPYGQFVEFSNFHMWKGKKVAREKHAFLYPTLEKHRPIIHDKIEEAVRKAIGG